MIANWTRCDASTARLAPRSSMLVKPLAAGIRDIRAGRLMPGSRPSILTPRAMSATVRPALTTASAAPPPTNSIARPRLLAVPVRNTDTGRASACNAHSEGTTRSRGGRLAGNHGCRSDGIPTSAISMPGSSATASSAAPTMTSGPWSPPWASTASVIAARFIAVIVPPRRGPTAARNGSGSAGAARRAGYSSSISTTGWSITWRPL